VVAVQPGLGQHLLGPEPTPDLDRAEIGGDGGSGRQGIAIGGGGKVLDLLQPLAVGPVDIAGLLAQMRDREGTVLAVILHDLGPKAGQHVAVRVMREGRVLQTRQDGGSEEV
jgi:hypothetical protein